MSKIPSVDAKTLEKVLLKIGFKKIRQKGSHVFYRHPDGRYTTLPFHLSKDVPKILVRIVLKEIGLSIDDFNKILRKL